jgi:enamine deaminase RidA (YjgF/YER057c/UK114 family)
MTRLLLAATLAATLGFAAHAAPAIHSGPAASPIAESVEVPAGADIIYLSGVIAPVIDKTAPAGSAAAYGDTTTQAVNIFKLMKERLAAKGLGLGDIVMMHIYMAPDPTKGGRMDFAGMMAGYTQFFGTPEQPNKPARSTVEVAGLVAPGVAMEIDAEAARTK